MPDCKPPSNLRSLILRLAMETARPDILDDITPYAAAVVAWQSEGFPVRDHDDREVIAEALCPSCSRYQPAAGRCGKQGFLVAVMAYIETSSCPLRRKDRRW